MMTNIRVKAFLNQQIMKISNLIQEKIKKSRISEKITHVRDRNLTEDRIYPKAEFHRMFRSSEVWIEHTTW